MPTVDRHTLVCALSRVTGKLTPGKVMAEYDFMAGEIAATKREYMVAISGDVGTLAETVADRLAEGWMLAGGVSAAACFRHWESNGCTETETDYTFCQSLTRISPTTRDCP